MEIFCLSIYNKDFEEFKKLNLTPVGLGEANFDKNWLNDKNHELKGIGCEIDGKIVGLAHYRKLLNPLKGKYIGYLDDIFVDPEYRGQKIAKKLLNKIKEISKANGWNLVRWQTDEDNFTAKKLYDKVATKTKKMYMN